MLPLDINDINEPTIGFSVPDERFVLCKFNIGNISREPNLMLFPWRPSSVKSVCFEL